MQLSEWLKQRRSVANVNQTLAAKVIGITQPQYSLLERGKFTPTSEMVEKLYGFFGKTDDEIVDAGQTSVESTPEVANEVIDTDLPTAEEPEESGFSIDLGNNVKILTDKYQYILQLGAYRSYYSSISSLIKALMRLELRTSAISSLQEVNDRLDTLDKKIDTYFDKIKDAIATELRNKQ